MAHRVRNTNTLEGERMLKVARRPFHRMRSFACFDLHPYWVAYQQAGLVRDEIVQHYGLERSVRLGRNVAGWINQYLRQQGLLRSAYLWAEFAEEHALKAPRTCGYEAVTYMGEWCTNIMSIHMGKTRAQSTILIHMRTGHNGLNSNLYSINKAETNMCPCGEGEHTVEHLLFDCVSLERQRRELLPADYGKCDDDLRRLKLRYLLTQCAGPVSAWALKHFELEQFSWTKEHLPIRTRTFPFSSGTRHRRVLVHCFIPQLCEYAALLCISCTLFSFLALLLFWISSAVSLAVFRLRPPYLSTTIYLDLPSWSNTSAYQLCRPSSIAILIQHLSPSLSTTTFTLICHPWPSSSSTTFVHHLRPPPSSTTTTTTITTTTFVCHPQPPFSSNLIRRPHSTQSSATFHDFCPLPPSPPPPPPSSAISVNHLHQPASSDTFVNRSNTPSSSPTFNFHLRPLSCTTSGILFILLSLRDLSDRQGPQQSGSVGSIFIALENPGELVLRLIHPPLSAIPPSPPLEAGAEDEYADGIPGAEPSGACKEPLHSSQPQPSHTFSSRWRVGIHGALWVEVGKVPVTLVAEAAMAEEKLFAPCLPRLRLSRDLCVFQY
uniref:Reverse transcriptase n=1 Tax=Colletotrichum fructicola (strain Nara gc5) TaxID=1213859 RepID=L2GC14_COLFN